MNYAVLEITPREQPTENSCGQTCLWMLTGHSIDDIFCMLRDSPTGSSVRRLKAYLLMYGWTVGKNLVRVKQNTVLPDLCLLRITWARRKLGHWALHACGQILDPASTLEPGWKISSYLSLTPPVTTKVRS